MTLRVLYVGLYAGLLYTNVGGHAEAHHIIHWLAGLTGRLQ